MNYETWRDCVHLTDEGLKNLKKLLKEKILYKLYDIEQDKKGPRKVTVYGNAKQPDCPALLLN